MNFAIISDVHIKEKNDEAYRLLMRFFDHEKTKQAHCIVLLGDIFDLMCGHFKEYKTKFPEFFAQIESLGKRGVEIHYFEGNHDFHLANLFAGTPNFFVHEKDWLLENEGKTYYFSHGDEFFLDEYGYRIYKKMVTSSFVKYLIEDVVSYDFFLKAGATAGKNSRRARRHKSLDFTQIRERFRLGVLAQQAKIKADFIICGHSHVKDDFTVQNKEHPFRMLNNGHALETKTFIYIEQHHPEFIHL